MTPEYFFMKWCSFSDNWPSIPFSPSHIQSSENHHLPTSASVGTFNAISNREHNSNSLNKQGDLFLHITASPKGGESWGVIWSAFLSGSVLCSLPTFWLHGGKTAMTTPGFTMQSIFQTKNDSCVTAFPLDWVSLGYMPWTKECGQKVDNSHWYKQKIRW